MKLKLMNTKGVVLSLLLLVLDAGLVQAATISMNGSTVASCIYTVFSADASGNLSVTCSGIISSPPLSAPVSNASVPVISITGNETTPPPQTQGSVLTVREWLVSFSDLNNIPFNGRLEPVGYYKYFKTLYVAKPNQYKLPNGGFIPNL